MGPTCPSKREFYLAVPDDSYFTLYATVLFLIRFVSGINYKNLTTLLVFSPNLSMGVNFDENYMYFWLPLFML